MPQSATDVANLALGHVGGADNPITDILTDTTKEAKLCRLHLDSVRKALLRQFIWSFAKKPKLLTLPVVSGMGANGSLIEVSTAASHGFTTGDRVTLSEVLGTTEANGTWTVTVIDPNAFDLDGSTFVNPWISGGYYSLAPDFGFIHMHTLPSDYMRLVKLETPRETQVDRLISEGKIHTDAPVLELTYIKDVTSYPLMDPLFYEALALKLADAICYGMTQSKSLREQIQTLFKDVMRKARHTNSVELPMQQMTADEWTDARVDGPSFVRDPMT